jgi:hypothetical protein
MSRASLVQTYIDALPFAAVAVVQTASGTRVAIGGEIAAGETAVARYFFRPLHIELVLGAAGLGDGPVDQAPDVVAARLIGAAKSVGAPFRTAAEIRANAKIEVDRIVAHVQVAGLVGELKEINKQYRAYRLAQVAKAERALPYSAFLERRYTVGIVKEVAAVGRKI